MRKFLSFALLFVCAGAVQAQEPVTPAPTPAEPATAQAARAPAAETPLAGTDMKTRRVTAADVSAARLRAPAEADAPAQGIDTPRNFWWLVGAIVLAGIILAVLL